MSSQEELKAKRQELCRKMSEAKKLKKLSELQAKSKQAEQQPVPQPQTSQSPLVISAIDAPNTLKFKPDPPVNQPAEEYNLYDKEYIKKRVKKETNREIDDLRQKLAMLEERDRKLQEQKELKKQLKEKYKTDSTLERLKKAEIDASQAKQMTEKFVLLKDGRVAYRKVPDTAFIN